MKIENALTSLPAPNWVIDQVVVFDWYDGPRQGVARMAKPECEFAFDLLAERHNPDGLDDRLFHVRELPRGSVSRVLDALVSLGSPSNPVWVPTWIFADMEERDRAEQKIERILNQQKDTGLVIHSQDMKTILGCWQDDRVNGQVQDWFSVLSIP